MIKRIVWILGAGFSRSLGAPLLPDLFTKESLRRIGVNYRQFLQSTREGHFGDIARLCRAGTHGLQHVEPVERQWLHAEEFVERLELATTNGAAREELIAIARTILGPELDHRGNSRGEQLATLLDSTDGVANFRRSALRFLAAEVCCFLEGADLQQERWSPYVGWAGQRNDCPGSEAVLTFNYDRVPDLLLERAGAPFCIPDPTEIRERGNEPWHNVPILKLHGSVDWKCDPTTRMIRRAEGDGARIAAMTCAAIELAIAAPGPSKRTMVDSGGALERIWWNAGALLRTADVIVFIGYRIPPSDAYTRDWLAKQIQLNVRNREPSSPLRVHTVLGDDTQHRDSRRMNGLLRALGVEESALTQWPMFAEDFLAVVDREEL